MKRQRSWLGRLLVFGLVSTAVACSEPTSLMEQEAAMQRSQGGGGWVRVEKVSGDGQVGHVSTELQDSLVVRVRDKKRGVSGVVIQWKLTAGTGSLSPAEGITDERGYARAAWMLGEDAGAGEVSATAAGIGSVTFSGTAVRAPAVARVEATPASATLGAGEEISLEAIAYDAGGQLVQEPGLIWNSLNPEIASIDAEGRVTARQAGTALLVVLASAAGDTSEITVTASSSPTEPGAFFVSTGGSDSGTGSQNSPWRTVGHALTKLEAGQTLYVRGGTYVENIKNPRIRQGRADARIRVAAYPGERPVIKGLLWLYRPSYWTLNGINVTWSTANTAKDHMVKMTNGVGWVYENSELWGARSFAGLLVYGSAAGEPADWVIRGNCIHDIWTDPIHHVNGDHNLYINTGTGAGAGLIERNILFNAPNGQNVKLGYGRSSPQPGDGTANVTVRYNTMYGSLKNLMLTDESHGNRIERNIIVGSDEGYALRAYRLTGSNNVISDNIFDDMLRLQYGDKGYRLATDGGGNMLPHDPQFDGVGCAALRPQDGTAQAYGRYAR